MKNAATVRLNPHFNSHRTIQLFVCLIDGFILHNPCLNLPAGWQFSDRAAFYFSLDRCVTDGYAVVWLIFFPDFPLLDDKAKAE